MRYISTLTLTAPEGTSFEDARQMTADVIDCAGDKQFGILAASTHSGSEREAREEWHWGSQGEPYRNETALHQAQGRAKLAS